MLLNVGGSQDEIFERERKKNREFEQKAFFLVNVLHFISLIQIDLFCMKNSNAKTSTN